MIDFTPLLESPVLMLFGAAAQFGIFMTLSLATLFGFSLQDAASVGIIGAADGPTSIFVANYFQSKYVGAIIVAAYSYMALVPIIQPPVIRLLTTKKERMIHMDYSPKAVSKKAKILFPILITAVAGIVAPKSAPLIGFLMFGNLIRECGVLDSLSETAQHSLANLITLILGLTVASKMRAEDFLNVQTRDLRISDVGTCRNADGAEGGSEQCPDHAGDRCQRFRSDRIRHRRRADSQPCAEAVRGRERECCFLNH